MLAGPLAFLRNPPRSLAFLLSCFLLLFSGGEASTCILVAILDAKIEFTIPKGSHGERLDLAFVAATKGISRSRAQNWIRQGRVEVDGEVVERPGYHVRVEQRVSLRAEVVQEAAEAGTAPTLELLYEDADLLVVDKPAGLLTHANRAGGHSVSSLLEESHGPLPEGSEPLRGGIVHRLDRDTSGALVVARTAAALESLLTAFRDRRVQKTYEGIVAGAPRFDSDWIETPLGRSPKHPDRQSVLAEGKGREALTYWEVIERFEGFAHLRLVPKTGRTHQLRVHLSSVGLPILADSIYRARGGHPARLPESAPEFNRHALHASELRFPHPTTGAEVGFEAPRPRDMVRALEWLRSERPAR